MKISDLINKLLNRTSPAYFVQGASVKKKDRFSSTVGIVLTTGAGATGTFVQVQWADDYVKFERMSDLKPADHGREFALSQKVKSSDGTYHVVGRIHAYSTDNKYSIRWNRGGFAHEVPADKIQAL